VPGSDGVAVEFNSLSKTYNMPGWRIGMAVGNAQVLAMLAQVKSNIDSGIFLPVQEAAVRALTTDRAWIEARNAIYQERMASLVAGLAAAGITASRPKASLYVWARVPGSQPAESYARRLLDRTGVAVAPGSFFGPGGDGHLRLSVTAPVDRIREAMRRLNSL
jgi:LL-diaminopimelate aminotransferase